VAPRDGLPKGTVTFLFTDIEGSTELLKRLGRDGYAAVLAEHTLLLQNAVTAAEGRVVDTQGDALFSTFRSARDAVSAAIEAQRRLVEHDWPEHLPVRVRMGLHSAEPKAGDTGYVGIGVHRAARIGAAAHGGQVLLSETARALVADDLPAGVTLRDLGVHRLKDIDEPTRLYQIVADGLLDRFPPPRTLPGDRRRRVRLAAVLGLLAVAAAVAAGVLLTTGSGPAGPVPLAANSVAVLDPGAGRPVGDVPLGFTPTGVDAGGDEVWVLNRSARTATAIDTETLEVARTVGLDGAPDSQYATGDTDWVAFAGGVDTIDSTGVNKILLWPASQRGAVQCFVFVTGDGRHIWVSQGRHVAVLDATSGNVLRRLLLPAEPDAPTSYTCYGLRYTAGALLAIRGIANPSIGTVDLESGSYTPIAFSPTLVVQSFGSANWASGFGSYWIGSQTLDTKTGRFVKNLTRLDPTSGDVTDKIVNPAGFFNLAVDPATGIWGIGLAGEAWSAAQVFRFAQAVRADPDSGRITAVVPLHHLPCCPNGSVGNGIAVGHGRLWVALGSP
jgi:class 3 adenylate cyclase